MKERSNHSSERKLGKRGGTFQQAIKSDMMEEKKFGTDSESGVSGLLIKYEINQPSKTSTLAHFKKRI